MKTKINMQMTFVNISFPGGNGTGLRINRPTVPSRIARPTCVGASVPLTARASIFAAVMRRIRKMTSTRLVWKMVRTVPPGLLRQVVHTAHTAGKGIMDAGKLDTFLNNLILGINGLSETFLVKQRVTHTPNNISSGCLG